MKTNKVVLLFSFLILGGCAGHCNDSCSDTRYDASRACNTPTRVCNPIRVCTPIRVCSEPPVYNPPRDCHSRYLPDCDRSYRGDRSYNSGY